MKPAIFLDRDGVINKPVFSKMYNEFQPPHLPSEVEIYRDAIDILKKFNSLGVYTIIVSNQPDFAKGKTSMKNLLSVHNSISVFLINSGVEIDNFFYCFHHPEGVIENYKNKCSCRKPATDFLNISKQKYRIDFSRSWMIGDRETDILFGKNGGLKTVLLQRGEQINKKYVTEPDFRAASLIDAFLIINKDIS